MNYVNIGSISHGTLLESDLIEAMADELDRIKELLGFSSEAKETVGYIDELLGDWERGEYEDDETYLLERLFDLLGEFAPAGTYFGSHPGDGSDIGFWPDFDSLEYDEDVARLSDPADMDSVGDGASAAWVVNDHGNGSYYIRDEDGAFRLVWSVV